MKNGTRGCRFFWPGEDHSGATSTALSAAYSFSRLYSVFRLTPNAAAVRSFCWLKCSSVARISWRSASAIEVPIGMVMDGPLAAGAWAAGDAVAGEAPPRVGVVSDVA